MYIRKFWTTTIRPYHFLWLNKRLITVLVIQRGEHLKVEIIAFLHKKTTIVEEWMNESVTHNIADQ